MRGFSSFVPQNPGAFGWGCWEPSLARSAGALSHRGALTESESPGPRRGALRIGDLEPLTGPRERKCSPKSRAAGLLPAFEGREVRRPPGGRLSSLNCPRPLAWGLALGKRTPCLYPAAPAPAPAFFSLRCPQPSSAADPDPDPGAAAAITSSSTSSSSSCSSFFSSSSCRCRCLLGWKDSEKCPRLSCLREVGFEVRGGKECACVCMV